MAGIREQLVLSTERQRFASLRLELQRFPFLFAGTALVAFGYAVFQVPHHLAVGGIAGLGLIVNHFTGWPVGLLYSMMNLPLLLMGFRQLGRWPFVLRTLMAAALFSLFTDLFKMENEG